MRGKLLIVVGLIFLSLNVNAQPVRIHNGFISGEQYLRMEDRERQSYAMGLVDGIFLAPLLGGSEERTWNLGTCVEGSGHAMTNLQLDAILSKYLRDRNHPQLRIISPDQFIPLLHKEFMQLSRPWSLGLRWF